jgi:hypothetical protein
VHFYRAKTVISKEIPIYLKYEDKQIGKINTGGQLVVELCAEVETSFTASIASDDFALFAKTRVDPAAGEVIYVKVGLIPGVDEPTLSIIDNVKAERQLSQSNKFTGGVERLSLGEYRPINKPNVSTSTNDNLIPYLAPSEERDLFWVRGQGIYNAGTKMLLPESDGYPKDARNLGDNLIAILYQDKRERANKIKIYDMVSNQLIRTITAKGYLSPDWTYSLKIVNDDLFRADIDINVGKITEYVQVTELGIFNKFEYAAWYGDHILFKHRNDPTNFYILNTLTGDLDLFEVLAEMRIAPKYFSPNGRYSLVYLKNSVGEGTKWHFLDMEMLEVIKVGIDLPYSIEPLYLDNHIVAIEVREAGALEWQVFDLENSGKALDRLSISGGSDGIKRLQNWTSQSINSTDFSTKRKPGYVIYSEYLCIEQDIPNSAIRGIPQKEVYFVNIYTGDRIKLIDNLNKLYRISSNLTEADLIYGWMDQEQIVYGQKGTITEQGLYMLNLASGEKSKLSSYIPSGILPMYGNSRCLVILQEELYLLNEGQELEKFEQVTNVSLSDVIMIKPYWYH